MALATHKDLCIDAVDPARLGAFWAEVIGLELHSARNGAVLIGPEPRHTVWINQVPEPKTVKHRVHLDVHGSSAASLLALGAEVVDDTSFRWVVMTDPEGGEFCLFVRDRVPDRRLYEVAVDCTEHEAIAQWWADLLGARRTTDPSGWSAVTDIPGAPFESLTFAPVDEAKTVKNRVHLDLVCARPDLLVGAGATMVRGRDEGIDWHVFADPEGNEFCVFAPD